MDHPLIDLINARIAAAERDGAFDNLPGTGQPLADLDGSADAAMARVLKTNGAVPEAVVMANRLATLRAALRDSADRTERAALISEIAVTEARLDQVKRCG